MKVVHCISGLRVGGAEMALLRTVEAMTPASEAMVVSLSDCGEIGPRLRACGVGVLALGKRPGTPDPRVVWSLASYLRAEKPDVLQTWMYEANLYGLVAGRLARVPTIVWNLRCSDMDWSAYRPLSQVAFRLGSWLSSRPRPWPAVFRALSPM